METVAQRILIPPVGVFRIVFLYVGQGESTFMAVPDGEGHLVLLVDCHIDESLGGIQLPLMLKDLGKTIWGNNCVLVYPLALLFTFGIK